MEQILRGVIVSVLDGVVMVMCEVRVMVVGGCWSWFIKGGQVILGVGLVLWLLVRGETVVTHDSCRVRIVQLCAELGPILQLLLEGQQASCAIDVLG